MQEFESTYSLYAIKVMNGEPNHVTFCTDNPGVQFVQMGEMKPLKIRAHSKG
ncbi:hypothetical protein UNDYM_5964 (plasmid) [Undibacterium sp. YM2]|nr:hypothetical protein UNDYM_5964 [Undibacterium sp. YM2]